MDLSTSYLGLSLKNPVICSASPLWQQLDNIRRAEDNQAAAVVLFSLYEEQIRLERQAMDHYLSAGTESYAEALSYAPEPEVYHVGPDAYLELIRKAKAAVDIPIIASLNGVTVGGWTRYATRMEQAGADALELNVYYIPTDPHLTGAEVEQTYLDILAAVKSVVSIPVAMKLSPYFSNMANMAHRLDAAGVNGLVLFNRFYQPDIDLETLEVKPNVLLSTPQALRLPLTWIGILYGRIQADMAASGGVHTAQDALKLLLSGASATMMTSALLENGVKHIRTVVEGIDAWMTEHEYDSVRQLRGSVSQMHAEDPSSFERAQYMRGLSTYLSVTR